jgi:diaminopimelate decarboxylase
VGKRADEIELALAKDILCFNVESESELLRIGRIAATAGKVARIGLRVNLDVDPKTHPYISTGLKQNKFGVPFEDAARLYRTARQLPGVQITGIDYHIGSQVTEIPPFLDALDRLLELVGQLEAEGIRLHHLDLGGGLGIRYRDEMPPTAADYVGALLERLRGRREAILLEPGRALVGNAGVLLTRVLYTKLSGGRRMLIVDAGMNDLLRPSLYQAVHPIRVVGAPDALATETVDVVGPICETGDFLGLARQLPATHAGALLAIGGTGAYGFAMSSQYNSRPRPSEVLVDGERWGIIRERESIEDLLRGEHETPRWLG